MRFQLFKGCAHITYQTRHIKWPKAILALYMNILAGNTLVSLLDDVYDVDYRLNNGAD